MLSDLTVEERLAVDDGMFIHTLETEEDTLLTLSLDYNQRQIVKAIREVNADVVVYDIFRDFGIGDLNTDKDMARDTFNYWPNNSQRKPAAYSFDCAAFANRKDWRGEGDRIRPWKLRSE